MCDYAWQVAEIKRTKNELRHSEQPEESRTNEKVNREKYIVGKALNFQVSRICGLKLI